MVERVRNAIAGLGVRVGQNTLSLSASFGIAERHAGENISDTINRADAALFDAKRAGRNRYEISG